MSDRRPVVLVLERPGGPAPELAAVLRERALTWAGELGEAESTDAPVAEAVAGAFAAGGRPVVAVDPAAAALGAGHARAALDDLADGADLVIGPGLGGGWYLVALAVPRPELFATGDWEARRAMEATLALAGRTGLEVGLLRPERLLAGEADLRAARVDPLTPPEVRAALG